MIPWKEYVCISGFVSSVSNWFGNLDRFLIDEHPIALGVVMLMRNNLNFPDEMLFNPLLQRKYLTRPMVAKRNITVL